MVNSKKAYAYFRDNFLLKKSSQGWFSFECPRCGKAGKCAVHFDYECVKCWVCDYKQSLIEWTRQHEDLSTRKEAFEMFHNYKEADVDFRIFEVTNFTKKTDVKLPYGFIPIMEGTGELSSRARRHIEDRGLSLKLLDSMGFGYVKEEAENKKESYWGYLIIPFKKAGSLYYFIGRDYSGINFLRYKNPDVSDFGIGKSELLFNEDALNKDTAFLTEGWGCSMTMVNSVATLGVNLSNIQKSKIINSPCSTIVIATDAGFYKQGLKMGMELMDYKTVYVLNLDLIAEPGKKDPNELGRQKILDLWDKTKPLSFSYAVNELL